MNDPMTPGLVPPEHLTAARTEALARMDRAVLKAKLPAWFGPLIATLIRLLPLILPLLAQNRQAVASGLAGPGASGPIPTAYDPLVRQAILAARAGGE